MSTFLIVHRHPENYRGTVDTPAAWIAWFERLGANLVDLGNPVFERTTFGNCGEAPPLGGSTLVTAEDLDAAVELAKSCPILEVGGGVEVGVLTSVPGRHHPSRVFLPGRLTSGRRPTRWSRGSEDLRVRNPKVEPSPEAWRVSGDSDREMPTLSSAAPRRLRMHGPPTSTFALTEVRAASEPTEPPPAAAAIETLVGASRA